MFQYGAGKALAERHGVALALDISGFEKYALRSFLLNHLMVPEAVASSAPADVLRKPEANFARARWKARINRVLAKAGLPKLAPSPHEYREPHFHYDPAFEALGSQTTMFGYFQSERYFASIADKLRASSGAPCEPLAMPPRPRSSGSKPAACRSPCMSAVATISNPARSNITGFWANPITAKRSPGSKPASATGRSYSCFPTTRQPRSRS